VPIADNAVITRAGALWCARVPEPAAGGGTAVALGCLLAAKRWIDVTSLVVCSIMKGQSPHSVPIALDPERLRVPLSPIQSLTSSSSSLGSAIRPRIRGPVLGVRRQNSAGTEWDLTATCVTAQEAVGQGGAVRRPRQPLSAVQFASITHTKARDGFRP
jgi:hypothetical protein